MKYMKRLAVMAVTVAVPLCLSASAFGATAPGYEEFADCPDKSVSTTIVFCLSSTVNSGHLQMGSKNTPVVDPIKMVAGRATIGLPKIFVGSFDGGRQPVPGGLVGVTGLDWLIYLFPNTVLGVYAETELAGQPGDPLATTFPLPIKVKLDNVLLSDTCYIGSDTNPIQLNLKTGTTAPPPPNTPITGSPGTQSVPNPALAISRIVGRTLVDNAFAAPAADGCDLLLPGFGAIDTLVNFQSGLPSPAGTNETVQNVEGALSPVNRVFPPDGFEFP